MSQTLQNSNSHKLLNSNDILGLTSEKPPSLLPLWEIFLGFVFALTFALLFYFGKFNYLENATIDLRFRQRGHLPQNHDIVLVSITDECIVEMGGWPWARKTHADLLSILKSAGAKTVAYDIIFSEPSLHGSEDDKAFAEAIKKYGRVVLPIIFQENQTLDNETGDIINKFVPERPIPEFTNAGVSEGYIDIEYKTLNPDGIIRKLLLSRKFESEDYYIFGVAAAADYLGSRPEHVTNGLKIGNRTLPFFNCYEPIAGKRMRSYLINYAGDTNHFTEISYSEVLKKKFPQGYFSNRLVIIGTRAKGASEDIKFCPYGALSGVQIHANVLHNILTQRFLHRTSIETTIILMFLFALSAGYILWKNSGFSTNLYVIGTAVLWGGFGFIIFNFDIITDITPICLMLLLQWAITRLLQQFITLRKKNYQLACKIRELTIINEISQAVNYMGDLEKTLNAILSRCVQVLDAKQGSLFLLDEKYEELVESATVFGIEGKVNIDEELKKQFKLGRGIAGEVFSSGQARLIQNIKKDKNFAFRDAERDQMQTMICVPLLVKDSAIGVMNIVNRLEGRFGQEDLQTAITMANQAAVVVEKAKLFNLATVDGLTGLVVHRHFQTKMEEEFRRAKRYDNPLSFMMTDIDHFKKFNDTWGHQTGDMVLREVARIVRDNARDTDIAARYGGEEFAVILPETDPDGAMFLAERLRQRIEDAAFEGPKGPLKVTISVGVCSLPYIQFETVPEMIKLADEALYACKRNGRNRVECATPEMRRKEN